MTTREEIITFAKQHLKKDVVYYRDGAELEWDDIKDLYEAAQRQAYERAAEVCATAELYLLDAHYVVYKGNLAKAIRALIERDGK